MPSRPGIAGGAGRAPTARMVRRARIATSPASIVSRSVKRAAALTTRTPWAVSRSAEILAAIAAPTAAICSRSLARLTWSGAPVTPMAGPRRSNSLTSAAAISALVGMDPVARSAPARAPPSRPGRRPRPRRRPPAPRRCPQGRRLSRICRGSGSPASVVFKSKRIPAAETVAMIAGFRLKATARERPPRPEVVRVDSIQPAPYKPGAAGPRGDDTI